MVRPLGSSPRARSAAPAPASRKSPSWTFPAAVGLLLLHLALLFWVGSRQSVTFDETFHLPAGVRVLARADFLTSYAQPPLAKAIAGAAALAAGAKVPADSVVSPGGERFASLAFMHDNAAHFQQVYAAGRLPMMFIALALAILVWRVATRWFGARAGLFALAAYAVSPEPLAHGSLIGVDVPTALTFFASVMAFHRFARTGRGWAWAALGFAAAFLTRFSAVQLFPACALLLGVLQREHAVRHVARAWWGLAALGLVAWAAVFLGYLGQGAFQPLGHLELHSATFTKLQQMLPGFPMPFPEAYVRGLDYLAYLGTPGIKTSYFMGQAASAHHVLYFPVAILIKYPLGWLALLAIRLSWFAGWKSRRARLREWPLLIPIAVVLGVAMNTNLDYGVRYVLPILPFMAVWASGLWRPVPARGSRPGGRVALATVALAAAGLELATAMPYPLAFFNRAVGGLGAGDRIVNDSNVDWGQGLIALREELAARGIRRVHLAYHGTVDPALYGIDYVPYLGGKPGPESDWIAVSSYYFVGLPSRMTTSMGQSEEALQLDFRPLWSRLPDARPAGCMYLFRLR